MPVCCLSMGYCPPPFVGQHGYGGGGAAEEDHGRCSTALEWWCWPNAKKTTVHSEWIFVYYLGKSREVGRRLSKRV